MSSFDNVNNAINREPFNKDTIGEDLQMVIRRAAPLDGVELSPYMKSLIRSQRTKSKRTPRYSKAC